MIVASSHGLASSLAGKSDEELVHIMVGGRNEARERYEAKTAKWLPENFWNLAPRDAALELIKENCPPELKQKIQFTLAADTKRPQPPDKGEIGLRWECFHCYQAERGLTVLRYAGPESALLYSRIEMFDLWHKEDAVLKRTVDQTKRIPLPEGTARQLYETIWWVSHVRGSKPEHPGGNPDEGEMGRVMSTGDGQATFWLSPDLPRTKVILYTAPISDFYVNGIDQDLYASFAELLLNDALAKHGVDFDRPTGAVGRDPSTYPEREFLEKTPPDPRATEETRRWVNRMLELLENPKHLVREWIIDVLVTEREPLRYADARIDAALFRLVDRGLVREKNSRTDHWAQFSEAGAAALALAARGRAELFPRLMKVLRTDKKGLCDWQDNALSALVLLSARHPEFRGQLLEYVKEQLVDPNKAQAAFETVWRADLRELDRDLEKFATASPDEVEPEMTQRFHRVRAILIAWRETDALCKLKLDAILATSVFERVPEFLHAEYQALPVDQQSSFRAFLNGSQMRSTCFDLWKSHQVKKFSDQILEARR
jgi:hypothetical protein